MLGICLPFHYHFEIKESRSEIKVDTNVAVWKEFAMNSEKYAPVRFNLFEIRISNGVWKEAARL